MSELPRAEYYLARELYGAGRISDAAAGFDAALNRARRVGQERWIDSIPPLVMLGECHYQMGSLAIAMEHYDAALLLAIKHDGWTDQLFVGVEQLKAMDSPAKAINWFPKSQRSLPVEIPGGVQISLDPTQTQWTATGELIGPVSLITRLDATEVLRTMGVALTRRWQILGPLARHSPLREPLKQLFLRDPLQRAPWVVASWQVLRGISQLPSPAGNNVAATIRSGAMLEDRFDYFMSPLAWQVLAELEAEQENFAAAIPLLQDACLVAAQYEQHDALAQGLQQLASAACANQRYLLIEPLKQAGAWCAKRSVFAQLSAFTGAAELAVLGNGLNNADQLLKQAWNGLQQRDIELPRLNAQAAYAGALLGYRQQRPVVGQNALDAALTLMRGTTQTGAVARPIFQTQMALDLLASKSLTARQVEAILDRTLAEPTASQWKNYPLETLASITTSKLPAYERWLELAMARGAGSEEVVARMDRLQRQRLYEALPLGGRLFSWRLAAMSEGPRLPPEIRQVLMQAWQRTPELQALPVTIKRLVDELAAGPLPLDERLLSANAKKSFTQLRASTAELENMVRFNSLMRNELGRYQLPSASLGTLQTNLRPGDCLLSFVVVDAALIGIALTEDSAEIWRVDQWTDVTRRLSALLGAIGLSKPTGHSPSATLASTAPWRSMAAELRDLLLPPAVLQTTMQAERLVIVPTAQLWYLPFELLPADKPTGEPWIARHRISYLPTLGAIASANSPRTAIRQTVGLVGNFFAANKDANEQQAQLLASSFAPSATIALSQKISVPHATWLALKTDRLWVAFTNAQATADWSTPLIPLGESKALTLAGLLAGPPLAPEYLVLPGWRTLAESVNNLGNGDELFLPACVMLTSGTRSVLISRWAVGGTSSQRLLERCMLEYEVDAASEAQRRAVVALWDEDFLTSDEPVLMPAGNEATTLTSGRHPLLWSGYMTLGDTVD